MIKYLFLKITERPELLSILYEMCFSYMNTMFCPRVHGSKVGR